MPAPCLPLPAVLSVRSRALLALLAVYLIWGTTMGTMRIGVNTLPPAPFVCARFLIAGVLLVAGCRLAGERWPTAAEWRRHALAGGLLFFAGNAVTVWAVQYIPTVLGAVLVATTPFWMIGLAAVLPPYERLRPLVLMGIALGFAGIVILLLPQLLAQEATLRLDGMGWLAVLAMLSTSFFWALGSLYAKARPVDNSLLMGVGVQNLCAAALLLPFVGWSVAQGDLAQFQAGWQGALALMYLVLFGTIVATPCYFYMLEHLSVSLTSTFAYVTPALTMLFGAWILHEHLGATTLAGSVVIFLGVLLVQRGQADRVSLAKPACSDCA